MPDLPRKILSIQSHVAYGYVGNRAAVFPLQKMGYDVLAVNTVQFSNHTGYPSWTGDIFTKDHIRDVLAGIREQLDLSEIDAVLTGYMGDETLGDIILQTLKDIKRANPEALYICDPVMGDIGRGIFVREGLPPFFANKATPAADIMTPNQFELGLITGQDIQTYYDAITACRQIHDKGPRIILVTSLITDSTNNDEISMLASSDEGEHHVVTTPRLSFNPEPNGSGDLTTALFAGHLLHGRDLKAALNATSQTIFKVFEETKHIQELTGSRELALIQAQDYFR